MDNNLWLALESRDALIAGDVARAKKKMAQLAAQEYRPLVPAAWIADMEAMQGYARAVAEARDLQEASRAMADVAVSCGGCHQKLFGGPLGDDTRARAPEEGVEDVAGRMKRHQWAANALWFGLARPSERDWTAGAEALVDAPLLPPRQAEGGVVDQEGHAAMERIRELGQDAQVAEEPGKRAEVYGEILASCFKCHASD